jgi:hypothetical protein
MKVGIPWYRRNQWPRWREIGVDRADMSESYDEWLEKAEETNRNFTKTALEVHKVDLDNVAADWQRPITTKKEIKIERQSL